MARGGSGFECHAPFLFSGSMAIALIEKGASGGHGFRGMWEYVAGLVFLSKEGLECFG